MPVTPLLLIPEERRHNSILLSLCNDHVNKTPEQKREAKVRRCRCFPFFSGSRTGNLVVLYWPVWKARLLRDPLLALLRPSGSAFTFECLLRQDVKVCGWKRASSGMNGFTFSFVFKSILLFSPPRLPPPRMPQNRAAAEWVNYRGAMPVCACRINTEVL